MALTSSGVNVTLICFTPSILTKVTDFMRWRRDCKQEAFVVVVDPHTQYMSYMFEPVVVEQHCTQGMSRERT